MTTTRSALRDQLGLAGLAPERRHVALTDVEMLAEGSGSEEKLLFKGHAAVFGIRTWIGPKKWGFWETVRSGAFAKTIKESDVRMLKNHDPNFELARSLIAKGPGSLKLSEDDKGLVDEAQWIATSYAHDLALSVRAGVITQQSIGFLPVKEEWSEDEAGDDQRELIEVELFDVSPVTFPAFKETDASMRAAQLGVMLEAAGLQDSDNTLLVRALRSGTITPDIAPTIRAAAEALAELAHRCEPGNTTRDGDMDLDLVARADRLREAIRTLALTHPADIAARKM